MAHTIDYWYQQILDEKARQPALNGITSTSKVSTFGLIAWVFAAVAWIVEVLFDKHFTETNNLVIAQKPHQPDWYKTQALAFQYGQAYNKQLMKYENIGLSDDQIAAQKIIAQASVVELETPTKMVLRTLVAKKDGEDIGQLSDDELAAFSAYMEIIKDGGVEVDKFSLPADSLKLDMDIFYDPLILDSTGKRIDGTSNTPVKDAINNYLRDPLALPFNGEYANTRLTDALQAVEGVKLPVIKTAWAKYGLFPYTVIDERYVPNGGYIRISDADLTINWRPYV